MVRIDSRYPQTVTLDFTLDVATVMSDGFKNDPGFTNFTPARFQFSENFPQLLALRDPRERLNEVVQRSKDYRRFVWGYAYALRPLLWSTGTVTHAMYDDEGLPVAVAVWGLPRYAFDQLPPLSAWFRFKRVVLNFFYKLKLRLLFWDTKHPFADPEMEHFIHGMVEEADIFYDDRALPSLKALPPADLVKANYPFSDYYYLHFFCVTTRAQGKGYGKKLLDYSMNKLPIVSPTFGEHQGPPKVIILATRAGCVLYSKFGFEQKKLVPRQLANSGYVEHTVMEKVLEPNKLASE